MTRLKSFILLFLSSALLFSSCEEIPVISYEDREYDKVICHFDFELWADYVNINSYSSFEFPAIKSYEDVVLYGKQAFYAITAKEPNLPYYVCYDEEYDYWMFVCETLYADGKYILSRDSFRIIISGSGKVILIIPQHLGNLEIQNIDYNTSNSFSFSYEDFSEYTGYTLYNEKLDAVTCAKDVIERAEYLYDKWMIICENKAHVVCYDEKNDCWLYYDRKEGIGKGTVNGMTMIIQSDGEMLLMKFESSSFDDSGLLTTE